MCARVPVCVCICVYRVEKSDVVKSKLGTIEGGKEKGM